MRRSLFLALTALILVIGGVVSTFGQAVSSGGAFLPTEDIRVSGQWLFKRATNPICVEGSTDDAYETCFTPTDPTADRTITLQNASGTVTLGAFTIVAGSTTLDGSNPTSVTTGLASLTSCHVAHMAGATPGDDPIGFTLDTHSSAGRLDIYAYKTNGTDPTWTASTNTTELIRYQCVGTA